MYIYVSSACTEDQQGHPKPLVSHTYAHSAPVTCLEFLESRSEVSTGILSVTRVHLSTNDDSILLSLSLSPGQFC